MTVVYMPGALGGRSAVARMELMRQEAVAPFAAIPPLSRQERAALIDDLGIRRDNDDVDDWGSE